MDKLNILNIAKGALVEQADVEIQRILENIADPNTEIKKPRKLTITMTFKPMDREATAINVVTKSSCVPYNAVSTQVFIGRNNEGTVVAEEFVKGQIQGQMKVIDTDTGEVISDGPSSKKILNINR